MGEPEAVLSDHDEIWFSEAEKELRRLRVVNIVRVSVHFFFELVI